MSSVFVYASLWFSIRLSTLIVMFILKSSMLKNEKQRERENEMTKSFLFLCAHTAKVCWRRFRSFHRLFLFRISFVPSTAFWLLYNSQSNRVILNIHTSSTTNDFLHSNKHYFYKHFEATHSSFLSVSIAFVSFSWLNERVRFPTLQNNNIAIGTKRKIWRTNTITIYILQSRTEMMMLKTSQTTRKKQRLLRKKYVFSLRWNIFYDGSSINLWSFLHQHFLPSCCREREREMYHFSSSTWALALQVNKDADKLIHFLCESVVVKLCSYV